jgi:hypothetical protein
MHVHRVEGSRKCIFLLLSEDVFLYTDRFKYKYFMDGKWPNLKIFRFLSKEPTKHTTYI